MSSPRWLTPFLFNLLLLAGLGLPALAAGPAGYVEDRAGILRGAVQTSLAAQLQELEQKTGVQFVILTVPTTAGIPIADFSLATAEQWGLGRKGRDNGLLLTVAVNDRRYRFETGYGLEGILPDSYLGTLTRQEMVPRFKAGDYAGGIQATAGAITARLAEHYQVTLTNAPQPGSGGGAVFFIFIMLLTFMLQGFGRRRQRTYWGSRGIYLGGTGGAGRSSGFGGGLGGGFGGGGISGSW